MKDLIIEVKDFRKVYGKTVAVDDICFEVHQGEIFGLLGPNGSGKTSTLEVLEGLRSSDRGVLRIMGIDPTRESRKLRNLIGVQLVVYSPGPQPKSAIFIPTPMLNRDTIQSTDFLMNIVLRDEMSISPFRWKESICFEVCSSVQRSLAV
jgi:ABC-type oligopeptide transport system ATPase subunit